MTNERSQSIILRGFRVEVSIPGTTKEVDNAWETVQGGSVLLEVPATAPASNSQSTPMSLSPIVLRGPMTKSRKALIQLLNSAGRNATRFDLTIVEIQRDGSEGKRFNYTNCFLTRYGYPTLSADRRLPIVEEVEIKPTGLVIQ